MAKKRPKVDDDGNEVVDSPPPEESNKSKYGDPHKYDPSFHGPIANRGCTDVICCILFILFIAGMFVVGYFGWSRGNPSKLIYPTDTRGQICGYNEAVQNKSLLFFFDLLACADTTTLLEFQCPTTQVCVNSCPDKTWVGLSAQAELLTALVPYVGSLPTDVFTIAEPTTTVSDRQSAADDVSHIWADFICDYDIDPKQEFVDYGLTPLALFDVGKCAYYTLESRDLYMRCIPSFFLDAVGNLDDVVQDINNSTLTDPRTGKNITGNDINLAEKAIAAFINVQNVATMVFHDFEDSWHLMLGGLFLASVLSFFWILIMRWIAGIMVYFGICAMFVLLVFGQYYCYTMYIDMENVEGSDAAYEFTLNLKSYLQLRNTWLAFGIILSVITLIMVLLLIFLCNRIRIAIALIKEGSRAVSTMMFTLIWPVIPFFLEVIIFVVWAIMAVYLATSGQPVYMVGEVPNNYNGSAFTNGTECDPETFDNDNTSAMCIFVKYGGDPNLFRMQIYLLFGLLWLTCFVVALSQMVLAGAFASYYWAFHKPKDIPQFPLTMSLWRSLRYHLGSLAFGSLLIAIVKMIRVMLEYIERKLKGTENQCTKFMIKCLKCCFWCLEKLLKFINKNAYIMIAIYGENFCTSAKNAFFLLMRNIVRVVVIDWIADFLLFIGKLCIVLSCGVGAFYFFTGKVEWFNDLVEIPNLNYYWIPILVMIIGTYAIATCFFSVYGMAVDTLFLCFLEDLERHNGSPEKPYYMNKELMKILGKKNKPLPVDD